MDEEFSRDGDQGLLVVFAAGSQVPAEGRLRLPDELVVKTVPAGRSANPSAFRANLTTGSTHKPVGIVSRVILVAVCRSKAEAFRARDRVANGEVIAGTVVEWEAGAGARRRQRALNNGASSLGC
ncbi:hypothetical protein ACFSSA_09365 [Luteolibacter algae]|uniref:Uncharacterized protein n=1 Tax=Luteolibacter algae TaxID=454151 RepID=A0ABW5D8Y7_9BACT